jgi:hypothetical protein
MGTSQSKRDAPPAAPLIPPWADQDPPLPEPAINPVVPPNQPAAIPQPPAVELAPPRRYAGFRSALGHFASSGDQRDVRAALGHWARTSTGGARAGAARVARAARTGGAALAGFARAGAGQPPVAGALDVRSLAGLPVALAVDRIVDAFCPPGILDEDMARLAMGEALATALAGVDTFDPNAIDANAVRVATLTFAAELVFLSVAGDGGRALAAAPSPTAAAQREADIRSLVREVADMVGTPILAAAGNMLTPAGMAALISQLVEVVQTEIGTW